MRYFYASVWILLGALPAHAQEPRTFTLTVTEQQLAVIGSALSELPYKTANPVIEHLAAQMRAQLASKEPPPPPPPTPDPRGSE